MTHNKIFADFSPEPISTKCYITTIFSMRNGFRKFISVASLFISIYESINYQDTGCFYNTNSALYEKITQTTQQVQTMDLLIYTLPRHTIWLENPWWSCYRKTPSFTLFFNAHILYRTSLPEVPWLSLCRILPDWTWPCIWKWNNATHFLAQFLKFQHHGI